MPGRPLPRRQEEKPPVPGWAALAPPIVGGAFVVALGLTIAIALYFRPAPASDPQTTKDQRLAAVVSLTGAEMVDTPFDGECLRVTLKVENPHATRRLRWDWEHLDS